MTASSLTQWSVCAQLVCIGKARALECNLSRPLLLSLSLVRYNGRHCSAPSQSTASVAVEMLHDVHVTEVQRLRTPTTRLGHFHVPSGRLLQNLQGVQSAHGWNHECECNFNSRREEENVITEISKSLLKTALWPEKLKLASFKCLQIANWPQCKNVVLTNFIRYR